ncbi:MAG: hypothetical protein IJM76_05680 [Lachnospiraceae bacterium]|nr:hypothetical protein [Lachnospiraceae bacterium]
MIVGPGGFADRFSRGRYDQDAIEEFLINLTLVDGLDYLEFADRLTILIEVDGDKFPLIIFDASEQKCVIRPGAVGTFFVKHGIPPFTGSECFDRIGVKNNEWEVREDLMDEFVLEVYRFVRSLNYER